VEELQEMSAADLKSLIEETLGIEIPDADATIDEGLDAALNMFFVSNTYATANGGLVVKIGDEAGSGLVNSSAFYLREELEDSEQAVRGTGEKVDRFYVTDSKDRSLTLETTGIVNMMGGASGNGFADAFLESTHLYVLLGICRGPVGQLEPFIEVLSGAYSNQEGEGSAFSDDLINGLVNELDEAIANRRREMRGWNHGQWEQFLEAFVREKSSGAPFR